MLNFICPHCKKRYSYSESELSVKDGDITTCLNCGKDFVIRLQTPKAPSPVLKTIKSPSNDLGLRIPKLLPKFFYIISYLGFWVATIFYIFVAVVYVHYVKREVNVGVLLIIFCSWIPTIFGSMAIPWAIGAMLEHMSKK
ncbi:MAG: hypothetical protein K6B46_00610 [Opitutales bacterium]|nr:hypothetical protein [Opitutales bacterium]